MNKRGATVFSAYKCFFFSFFLFQSFSVSAVFLFQARLPNNRLILSQSNSIPYIGSTSRWGMISAIFASVLFLGFLHFTISNTVAHPSMMQRDCPAIEGIFDIWEHSVHTYRPFSTSPSVTNRWNESTLSGKIGQILYRFCQSSQRVGCTTGISIVRLWHLLSGFSAQRAHWWVLRWFLSFELSKKFHKSSKSRIFLCISHWNARRRQRFSLFWQ